jgi:alpha-beta hydrolase superfamily lysophospholipase
MKGARGALVVHRWRDGEPRYVALVAHGLGEHAGRYGHVATRLVADGARVYAPDHYGHGRSDGERAIVDDLATMVEDLHGVAERAAAENPGLPTVLVGHSMGAVVAARYAQLRGSELSALVLSGPPLGGNPAFEALLEMDPIPEVPIDPAVLSRDPAVGQAYAEDPLVYHGPLTLTTLQGILAGVQAVAQGGTFGELPTLWLHGEEDALAPLEPARAAIEGVRGKRFESKVYPQARHEIFNETNRDEVLADVIAFVDRSLPQRRADESRAGANPASARSRG